jgi:hypothetical protein
MIIERRAAGDISPEGRREYISATQGAAPEGWRCVAVCGYHETAKKEEETQCKNSMI